MAVQPQTPYKEYTANGSTKSFALEFDCDNQDHLIVLVDDVEAIVGTWSLSNGAVVFGNAPATGKKITVQRNTPFRRDGDFQSYDNSFRPGPVNKGFDWIWLKLQELGVADWILSNRINDLRAYVDKQDIVLQDNIDSLKNYVDDKDDELRNYLLNAIQEQGVALDQLEEYYSYLMQQLAQVAIDRGWAASFIVSADGSTQQEINDFGGAKWWDKPLGYGIGATVKLDNGDIVKSTINGNVNDPNVDMTGWFLVGSDKIKTVLTLDDMLSLNPVDQAVVRVLSYHAPNYALAKPYLGSSEYLYKQSTVSKSDGFFNIKGWNLIFSDTVDIYQVGFKGDYATDEGARLNSFLDAANEYVKSSNINKLILDGAHSYIMSSIPVTFDLCFVGARNLDIVSTSLATLSSYTRRIQT